ncbi:hypothetical protein D3C75_540730 [compost metagenome]
MRKEIELKFAGIFEKGINFSGQDGTFYKWYSRNHNSPLFFLNNGEVINVTADIEGGILKNIRMKKKE